MLTPRWNDVQKLLCIRPDNMGDILMSSPAIRALKETQPNIHITLLTSHMGARIARLLPEIDNVIEFNVPWVKMDAYSHKKEMMEVIRRIKKDTYDAAIIFTTYSQNPLPSAFLCYLAEIPKVLGYCRENPYGLISDWIPDEAPFYEMKHQVIRDLELVYHIGARVKDNKILLKSDQNDVQSIKSKLKQKEIEVNKPFIVIHPGVSEVKRQYSLEKCADIADVLQKQGYQVVVTGGENEIAIADFIQQHNKKVISMAGECTLEEFIALISLASVLISSNTGPVHIAAGVQTPVVVLYALTNPEHLPWRVNHRAFFFEVPPKLQSKNTILRYTNDRFFKPVDYPQVTDIVKAAEELIKEGPRAITTTDIVNLVGSR